MSGYPIILTGLSAGRCVVVGGGTVAARKAEGLVAAGARPVVISPELGHELQELAAAGRVEPIRRSYRAGDLAGASLAVAAAGERAVNVAVAQEARERGIPVNVVDDPVLCTFYAPAVIRRGDVLIAISTGGQAPALARRLREILEGTVDPAYGELASLLAELRPRVLEQVARPSQPAVWDRLLDGELLDTLRTEGMARARERAEQIVSGYSGGRR